MFNSRLMLRFRNGLFSKAIIVMLTFSQIFVSCTKKESKKADSPDGKVIPVEAILVQKTLTNNSIATVATVLPGEFVILRSEITGKVVQIAFEEGSSVQKGQLLIRLEDADLQAELKKLDAQLHLVKSDEKRQAELLKINAISQEQYDKSKTNLLSLQAEIELIKAKINKTHIVAPFSGKTGLRKVSEGDFVTSGTELVSIADQSGLKLEFSIPSKYASFLNKGSKVSFDYHNQSYEATVYASEPKADPSTGNLTYRAKLNGHSELFPGTNLELKVPVSENTASITIPTQALIPDVKGQKVFIIKQGKAETRVVKTGTRTEIEVEILEGLSEGDSLIISGLLHVKPGSAVQVSKER